MQDQTVWERTLAGFGGKSLLLVGEGNFSFAAALLEHQMKNDHKPSAFVATAHSTALDLKDLTVHSSVEAIEKNGGRIYLGSRFRLQFFFRNLLWTGEAQYLH